MSRTDLLPELEWRGLLYQQTSDLPRALAAGPVTGYCGFDPTAPSLHVGNLVPVMALVHLQRAGHRPIVLVGGGTGLIGDPSGKRDERTLKSVEEVEANTASIRAQLERFLDFDSDAGKPARGRPDRGALMRDNGEWLRKLELIPFLRDIGKHFRVNQMLAKESVKARLESEVGISFTEFAYMLTQAYDFLVLYQQDGAVLQIGGSDQWGNITAGIDLIHRVEGGQAHGLTVPLVTTASGSKFGKSEAGAVWLDPALTSPYKFYQFWVNADDRDVGKYLRYFTLLDRKEIEELDRATAERPGNREAQRALARDVTARVHGDDAAKVAVQVSELLFGGGDPRQLTEAGWEALRAEVPYAEVSVAGPHRQLPQGSAPAPDGTLDVAELFVAAKLVKSRGEARRLLEQGGAYLNGERLGAADRLVGLVALLAGNHILLRRGSRDYAVVGVRE